LTRSGVDETVAEAAFVERWDDVARRAASRVAGRAGDEPAELRELLVIWLDGDPYALPIERVREIVRLRPITPVPRVPDAVRGVISLRGEIVQVLDLRRRLGLPGAELDAAQRRHRIVVLHGDDGQLAGLLVDRVSEVLRTPADGLRAPATREADAVAALVPLGERFASLFDVDRLLELGRRGERSTAP
jgi:purine-binding chemotaxis protein CheW